MNREQLVADKLLEYLYASHSFAVTPSAEKFANLEYYAREYQLAKYPPTASFYTDKRAG